MKRKPLPEINITPLVDVLLVLVVLLILAMPLYTKKLPVNLPKTDVAGAPLLVKSLSIVITAKGQYLVDNGPVSLEQIKKLITPSTTVQINADASVPYENVAKLVSTAQASNPKDIALMVQ